jgi:hypothetical protein
VGLACSSHRSVAGRAAFALPFLTVCFETTPEKHGRSWHCEGPTISLSWCHLSALKLQTLCPFGQPKFCKRREPPCPLSGRNKPQAIEVDTCTQASSSSIFCQVNVTVLMSLCPSGADMTGWVMGWPAADSETRTAELYPHGAHVLVGRADSVACTGVVRSMADEHRKH